LATQVIEVFFWLTEYKPILETLASTGSFWTIWAKSYQQKKTPENCPVFCQNFLLSVNCNSILNLCSNQKFTEKKVTEIFSASSTRKSVQKIFLFYRKNLSV
jgi:hypothetical protein